MPKPAKYFLFSLIIFIFFFALAEVTLRVYQWKVKDIPFTKSVMDFNDSVLGWEGKKIFGNPNSPRKKLFVIGDSYTDGVGADETKMYYRTLAKQFDMELFIYGGGGFGTLQEYLVLDQYIDEIKPDLILLQFCSNDFTNNSWHLEKESYSNNNLLIRPYWIDGEIKYYYPRNFGKYRVALTNFSRLLYMFFNSYDVILADLNQRGVIKTPAFNDDYKPFRESVKITEILINKFKERAGNVPVVVVGVNTDPVFSNHLNRIFNEAGILYTEEPMAPITAAKLAGKDLRVNARVGHWNAEGHQMFGAVLFKEVQQWIARGQLRF